MNPVKLVRMANDIAANFDCGPDRDKAVAGVADHLRRFWSPGMLDEIAAHMRAGGAGLSPLAAQALADVIAARGAP